MILSRARDGKQGPVFFHPAEVTERRLTLKRVSPAFAEAVREYRASRKGEEQPEDYRRKFRPRPSSGYQEDLE